jgi:hypothetical protein
VNARAGVGPLEPVADTLRPVAAAPAGRIREQGPPAPALCMLLLLASCLPWTPFMAGLVMLPHPRPPRVLNDQGQWCWAVIYTGYSASLWAVERYVMKGKKHAPWLGEWGVPGHNKSGRLHLASSSWVKNEVFRILQVPVPPMG